MTNLYCAICWCLPGWAESDAPRAVSIAGGYALCEEHMTIDPDILAIRRLIAFANQGGDGDD